MQNSRPLVYFPLVEDDLQWKTTFGGRHLLVEDDPCMLPSPLCGIFPVLQVTFTLGKPLKKMSQKVEKVQKGGGISAENQKVQKSKYGLFEMREGESRFSCFSQM